MGASSFPYICKLCGGINCKILSEKQERSVGFKLIQCKSCGFCFVDPLPPKGIQISFFEGEEAPIPSPDLARFNRKVKRLSSPMSRFLLQVFKNYKFYDFKTNWLLKVICCPAMLFTLKNIIPFQGQGRVLDIGCNNGLSLAILQSLGWKVQGVEQELSLCKEAEKLGITTHHGTLETANFPSKSLDVVIFNQVFEHLDDPLGILKEVKRILADDGRIYIEVPNQRSFAFHALGERFYGYPMHIHIFSPSTMSRLCKQAGLKVRRVRVRCGASLFIHAMRQRCNESPLKAVRIFSPFLDTRLGELLLKSFQQYILHPLRLGDVMLAEISK